MGMTQRKNIRTPAPGEIQHTAGEYLYKHGSCSEADLFRAVDFGPSQHERAVALQSAIRNGWLMETSRGKIACSPTAVDYYDAQDDKPVEKYVGQIAPAPTRNVFAGSGLSEKYQINSRGSRLDIPSWSVRENVSFHTKA
jgi:hypothetical protein